MTVLQYVKVLGVNAKEGTIVLQVNPNEAQYAALSRDQGTISLSLRAKGDSGVMPLEVASYRKLLNN
jgi:Flp pilus assembly protein CpaB